MVSKEDVARELVEYHVLVEDQIIAAFRYEREGGDRDEEPIKLLEVSRATVPAGISPIYFGATNTVPFPVVIVEVTEEEFHAVEGGEMRLPEGWERRAELHRKVA